MEKAALWTLIIGIVFLGLAVLFFMGLVIASLVGFTVPDNSRLLPCIVLALTSSIGSGFLGGSAVAQGQLSVPRILATPIRFGVTGGVAVLIIVLILCYGLYPSSSQPIIRTPSIINVTPATRPETDIVDVDFEPLTLPPQYKLYLDIASDDQFKQAARMPFLIGDSSAGKALVSLPKSNIAHYWIRFIVKSPEGKEVAKSNDPRSFTITR